MHLGLQRSISVSPISFLGQWTSLFETQWNPQHDSSLICCEPGWKPLACGNTHKFRPYLEGFDSKVKCTYPSVMTVMPIPTSLSERHTALTPNSTLKVSINIFCSKPLPTASAPCPWGCWNLVPKPGKAPGCNMQNDTCIAKHFCESHSACEAQRALATFTLQDYEKMYFTCEQILF